MQTYYDLPSQAVRDFDYEKSAVTRPNSSQNTPVKKYTKFVLDSRDRNTSLFPAPSSYEIILNESINDVTSVEIVKSDVPLSSYDVNEFNNILHATFNGGQVVAIAIPVGNYNTSTNRLTSDTNTATLEDMASFAESITSAVAAHDQTFSCQYLRNTDSFACNSSNSFTFEFNGPKVRYGVQMSNNNPSMVTPYSRNSIGKLLGFAPIQYLSTSTSTSSNTIVSVYRRNFQDNRYCVLNIENMSLNNSINSIIYRSFAIMDGREASIEKYFNPAIRLNKMRVQFTDYFGNLYNFQNIEHRIEMVFESTSNTHVSKLTNI